MIDSNIRHNRKNLYMGMDGVGSFPTVGGCDDSEESDWPTATTRSKRFR